jgi:proteasome lid subunit RPN8/RPN11
MVVETATSASSGQDVAASDEAIEETDTIVASDEDETFIDNVPDEPIDEADVEEAESEEQTAVTHEPEPYETGAEAHDKIDSIVVSEPQPVFEEREAPLVTEKSETIIAPSQARVRIAGIHLPIDDPTPAAVDITIEEPALRAAQAHALSSLSREVAGVLIGPRPEKQPDGRYRVHILDTIIAKHTVMNGASVTYTPESWRYMTDTLRERYPDETAVIVGWYHTHPGFGIFLSGMDQFIHQNFFTQIWHIAYVLDPRAQTSGFFSWNRQKTEVSHHNFGWPDWAAGSW